MNPEGTSFFIFLLSFFFTAADSNLMKLKLILFEPHGADFCVNASENLSVCVCTPAIFLLHLSLLRHLHPPSPSLQLV